MDLSNPQEMGVLMGNWLFLNPYKIYKWSYEPRFLVTGAHLKGEKGEAKSGRAYPLILKG